VIAYDGNLSILLSSTSSNIPTLKQYASNDVLPAI